MGALCIVTQILASYCWDPSDCSFPLSCSPTTANYWSRTFLFSAIVLILQSGMLIVTFVNIVDLGPDGTQSKLGLAMLMTMVCFVLVTSN
jgi:hypothetical protein